MSTDKQTTANRRNAGQSTGPRTTAGLTVAAGNALTHGLSSVRPVLPGESPDDWDRHRAGVLASLAPVGTLEEALADRVAVCLWRLRRVVAYETAVSVTGLEEAADPDPGAEPEPDLRRLKKLDRRLAEARDALEVGVETSALFDRLPGLADDAAVSGAAAEGLFDDVNNVLFKTAAGYFHFESDDFLTDIGMPPSFLPYPWDWPGWTAGLVRRGVALAASQFGAAADDLLTRAAANRREWVHVQQAKVGRLEADVRATRTQADARQGRQVLWAALPDGATLDRITRYEAHLSRQATQALHTLERLQAARLGRPVAPPVAIDVTVAAPGLGG
ncbi:hypothetical protein [Fimbriiglobus ruber]|uniref:Uncharacterized protein n=1 Tax=Fimbriiglobus ruber TaxID=1908690 RepID=A0A225E686_9BACT|nr:hypothetical protein [Fimbriiglobus ruber]OWK45616.1 hypothetical protein FRUB_01947 [Fimbriiglobus ruber]